MLNEMSEDEIKQIETIASTLENTTTSPVNIVEDSLASFVQSAFDVTKDDFDFGKKIQESLMDDLDNNVLEPNQKIALYSSFSVNSNDRVSKLLSPIMSLMTARQQAEMSATAQIASAKIEAEKSEDSSTLNKTVPKDVLQGMVSLSNVLGKMMDNPKES